MRKGFKETAICVIILTVLASFAGCMDWDRDDEGVINAAKVYAESVVKLRTGKTVSSIYEPEDDLKSRLNDLLAGEGYEESYHDICEAIASTLEYEINEDSVESSVKKSEGSVIVSFSVVDSDAVYDMVNEEGGKFDDFIDALTSEDAPVTEYTMTLDLIFKDGKWLRVAGELVSDDRREIKQAMLDAYPSLQNMYSADDDNTEVLYFKNAIATFSSFTDAPETIKF